MSKIIQLSEQMVAKIAAGEVIERPVYAVKELVENAIDAKATSIIIHIEQSGLRKITLIDNGEGMSKEDLLLAFQPHTTSKLSDEDGLSHISTHGFRGEALSSIAAISTVTISSRIVSEALGTLIVLEQGIITKTIPTGLSVGTHITIENLFSNVPARKKFLKSEQTEFRHITDIVVQFALAYPQIRFVLTHNGKQIFDLTTTNTIHERIHLLFGKNIFTSLLQVKHSDSYTNIVGYITSPEITTSSGHKQYLFVNNRRVTDVALSSAVKEAYGNMLPSTKYPVFVLFLTLPYELVDVNVHPRKEQVRFINNQQIYEAIKIAVDNVLKENNLTFSGDLFTETNHSFSENKIVDSYAGQLIKETETPWDVRNNNSILSNGDTVQLHNVYLVTQTSQGFILIDQHAAHERILYEQYLQRFQKENIHTPSYSLSTPFVLNLSIMEKQLVEEYHTSFNDSGFELIDYGGNSIAVTSVPEIFKDRDISKLLAELIKDLGEETNKKTVDFVSEKMLKFLACRSAIMAGEKLTKKQMKDLIEKLEETPNNATCPHGRPTKIAVDLDRLHILFKRK